MASSKDMFEADMFKADMFAAGWFRGTGVTASLGYLDIRAIVIRSAVVTDVQSRAAVQVESIIVQPQN